jgi:hypothetical protein
MAPKPLQLEKLTRPRLHKAATRGHVSDEIARLRGGCDSLVERQFAGAAA